MVRSFRLQLPLVREILQDMTDEFTLIAHGSIAIFGSIGITIAWATMARWILQIFEKMINVMDVGHFPERTYD